MTRDLLGIILALSFVTSAFGQTVYPLADRVRMHEQSCYTNAPDPRIVGNERWAAHVASCLAGSPSR